MITVVNYAEGGVLSSGLQCLENFNRSSGWSRISSIRLPRVVLRRLNESGKAVRVVVAASVDAESKCFDRPANLSFAAEGLIVSGGAKCEVHKTSYFGNDLILKAWGPDERISIGKYCSISEAVVINTGGEHHTNFASTYPFDEFLPNTPQEIKDQHRNYRGTETTVIENDVWVGYGAFISGGVTIHSGAVVGSKAVVFSDVPPYAIVVGNPARVVRYRFSKTVVDRLLKIAWWDWPLEEIQRNVDWFYEPIDQFIAQFDPQEPVNHRGRVDHSHSTGSTHQPAHRAVDSTGQLGVD